MILSRRTMLAALPKVALTGGLSLDIAGSAKARAIPEEPFPHLPRGGRILFQGDSITDGGRGRSADPNHIYGQDYAYLVAAHCGGHFPDGRWTFLNRGVSGNKVTDLSARWQSDALDLLPDLLSILIGVNDSASVVQKQPNPVTSSQYEQIYDQILQQTVTALPHIRFVLCDPFVLPVGKVKEMWADYQNEVRLRREAVGRLATKYHAPVVSFQQIFDAACQRAPAEYWIWDGVHPTYAGHQLMADEWLRVVNASYPAPG